MLKSMISSLRVSGVASTFRVQTQQLQRTLSESANQEVNQEVAVNQNTDEKVSRVKISIPYWAVPAVIGTKGENINKMRKVSETEIKISNFKEYFPGWKERVVMFEGDSKNVVEAVHKIVDVVRSMELPEHFEFPDGAKRRQNGVRLIIPRTLSSTFIGKAGEIQREIREQFALDLFSLQGRETLPEDFNEGSIYMAGEEENVKKAVNYVIEKLDTEPKQRLDRNLSYQQTEQLRRTLSESANQEVNQSTDDKVSRVKISIPYWAVPAVIGTKGENINKMTKDSEAKIQISKFKDSYFPGSKEPVILIEGEIKNVVEAVHKIVDFVRSMELPEHFELNVDQAKRRQNGVKLMIPKTLSGTFIGKAGEIQREIRERFALDSFSIQSKEALHGDLNERPIYMAGEEENVKKAVNYVIEKLDTEPVKRLDRNLSYKKFYRF